MNGETIWENCGGKRKRNKFAERMQILLFMLCCVDVFFAQNQRGHLKRAQIYFTVC